MRKILPTLASLLILTGAECQIRPPFSPVCGTSVNNTWASENSQTNPLENLILLRNRNGELEYKKIGATSNPYLLGTPADGGYILGLFNPQEELLFAKRFDIQTGDEYEQITFPQHSEETQLTITDSTDCSEKLSLSLPPFTRLRY